MISSINWIEKSQNCPKNNSIDIRHGFHWWIFPRNRNSCGRIRHGGSRLSKVSNHKLWRQNAGRFNKICKSHAIHIISIWSFECWQKMYGKNFPSTIFCQLITTTLRFLEGVTSRERRVACQDGSRRSRCGKESAWFNRYSLVQLNQNNP